MLWEAGGVQVSGAAGGPSFARCSLYLLLLKQPVLGNRHSPFSAALKASFPCFKGICSCDFSLKETHNV